MTLFEDYSAVFDFQRFLDIYSNEIKENTCIIRSEIHDLFNLLKKEGLNDRLCVHAGDVMCSQWDDIGYNNKHLIIYGSNGGDVDNFYKFSLIPDKLFIVRDEDPRKSYMALSNTPISYEGGIEELHGSTISLDRDINSIFFYPHFSLLLTREHQLNTRNYLGLNQESIDNVVIPCEINNDNWHAAIFQRAQKAISVLREISALRKSLNGTKFSDPVMSKYKRDKLDLDYLEISFNIEFGSKETKKIRKAVHEVFEEYLPLPGVTYYSDRKNWKSDYDKLFTLG